MLYSWFESWVGLWAAASLFIVLGVVLLKFGADWLVGGSSNLGLKLGLSATVTGLTIVALGTSAPELAVSVLTALQGHSEICLGNVVGSNMANSALIVGGTAMVIPFAVCYSAIRDELWLSALSMLAVFFLCWIGDGLSRLDSVILFTVFTAWLSWVVWASRHPKPNTPPPAIAPEPPKALDRSWGADVGLVLVGLIALVLGADTLVDGAVAVAEAMAVPKVVIGLTIVAGGTSLPELAVSLVAACRKQAEIIMGNVLGSNIFNALFILGVAGMIAPIPFADAHNTQFTLAQQRAALFVDIPVCILLCSLLVPLVYRRRVVSRRAGTILFTIYMIYLATLVLRHA